MDLLDWIPVRPGDTLPDAQVRRADPGYFTGLQIPLLEGRFFLRQDDAPARAFGKRFPHRHNGSELPER